MIVGPIAGKTMFIAVADCVSSGKVFVVKPDMPEVSWLVKVGENVQMVTTPRRS